MGISLACDVTDETSFNNKAIGGSRSNDKEHNSGRSHYYMELFFSTCRKKGNVEMAKRVAVEQRVFMKETQVKKEIRAVRWSVKYYLNLFLVDEEDRCYIKQKEMTLLGFRFKLIANLKDDSSEANFLLFDTNAQMIVRRTAAEFYDENEDPDFLPEAISDLFGKRLLFEISVDSDNIRGKSSQYLVRCANDDREMIEDFAALPHKPVLMLLASDEISDGSGGSSATHVSKRKIKGEEDNDVEDQLSVKKKQGQKKIKGE
ncbi:BnaC06g02400D [Brassica napus]|uniref:BnaC06g02400D protein n=1 Tax=Brassica napus TaxID=3708 RepID=A0A078IMF9_BRANA|nr:BnaC06g02400D [Brassica napus]